MAAESSSKGLFVAPMTSTRSSFELCTPSNAAKNSVFIRLEDSCSDSFREQMIESISSKKYGYLRQQKQMA